MRSWRDSPVTVDCTTLRHKAVASAKTVYVDHPMWCGDLDDKTGPAGITMCGSTPELCMRAIGNFGDGKGPCRPQRGAACFRWRGSSGHENGFCFAIMEECIAGLEVLTSDDIRPTSECFVMQQR